MTEQTNMEWLVRFLGLDIPRLTRDELSTVLQGVRQIARLALSDQRRPFARWEVLSDATPLTTTTPGRNCYREGRLRDNLMHYQHVLKDAVGHLSHTQRRVLHVAFGLERGSIPFEIVTGRTHPALLVRDGTIAEVFLAFDFRIVFVLQACADRLAVCQRKDCAKVFLTVSTRADKTYCDRTCGSVVRVRKKRAREKAARLAKEQAKKSKTRRKKHKGKSQQGGNQHAKKR
jgi:hypothetical protein